MEFNCSDEYSVYNYGVYDYDKSAHCFSEQIYYIYHVLLKNFRVIDEFFRRYFLLLMCIISVPGNVIIIGILLQQRYRHVSTALFLISLAIADILVMFNCLFEWIEFNYGYRYTSDLHCRIMGTFFGTGPYASSWMLVIISVERLVSVAVPLHVKRIITMRFAKVSIALVWTLSIATSAVVASFEILETDDFGSFCGIEDKFVSFYYNYMIWIGNTLRIIAPFVMIFICSTTIIVLLSTRKMKSSKSSKKFRRSVTMIMLIINIVFLVTQIPLMLMILINHQTIYSLVVLSDMLDVEKYFRTSYLTNCFLILSRLNSVLNFYVYFVTESRFRQDIKDVLIRCKQTTFCQRKQRGER